MREILFRGKSVDTGEWVEGAYYKQTEFYGTPSIKPFIITSTETLEFDQDLEYCEVIPETIGQYTGLRDHDGKKIFEGDIIINTMYRFDMADHILVTDIRECRTIALCSERYKIVGNTWDNPELTEMIGARESLIV